MARGIGLTEGRLGRVLSGEHSLSVESCLRFAQLSGESPSRVLRAAGKGEIASLIEKLYNVSDKALSPTESAMLAHFRALAPRSQQTVRDLLKALAAKQAGSG